MGRVSFRVIGSLALSMIGVGLITQPAFLFRHGTDHVEASTRYNRGACFAFGSALIGGLLPILVRKSRECHWATVIHVASLCSCVLFTPVAIAVQTTLEHKGTSEAGLEMWDAMRNPQKLLLIGLMALVSFAGLGFQTFGYQVEEAARASAMNFLEIPFSYVLQWWMFGDLLSPLQGLGMTIVVMSGLGNLYPVESPESRQQINERVPFSTSPGQPCRKFSPVLVDSGALPPKRIKRKMSDVC